MSRRLFTIRTAPQNTKLSCEGIKIVTAIPMVRHPKATLGRELPFCADFNDIDLSKLVTGDCALGQYRKCVSANRSQFFICMKLSYLPLQGSSFLEIPYRADWLTVVKSMGCSNSILV